MENPNQHITEDLLGKFLARETDAQESAMVHDWLAQNKQNQKQLADLAFIWEQTQNLKQETRVDIDLAWSKVKTKIQKPNEAKIIPLLAKRVWSPARIAASITVFVSAVLMILFFVKKEVELLTIQTGKNTLQQILPDGSSVFLNKNTKLTYPSDFEGDTREITLLGEAFFDIQRDESKPFIIHASGTDVKVLGTSFNIKAYDKNVRVNVESGKVQFIAKKHKTILEKGEEAAFEAEKDTILKQPIYNKNAIAYKTKTYVFEDTSLENVIKILSDGYEAEIKIRSSAIKTCRLTTTFENESLPNALNVIAETLNLQVSKEGNKYTLDGQGCNQN
ncbi:MAG: FecR domain-containing protein [Spirosomaceae bacterium]|nr:FecR domain-containing protein [Spirosomataceae bacterium]